MWAGFQTEERNKRDMNICFSDNLLDVNLCPSCCFITIAQGNKTINIC